MKLPFWNIEVPSDKTAVYWKGNPYLTYSNLLVKIEALQKELAAEQKCCVLVFVKNSPDTIALLTAVLANGHALMLADGALSKQKQANLIDSYRPSFICIAAGDGSYVITANKSSCSSIHQDLCLLLSTSGSTGSPKYVRLSTTNVLANANAIAESLNIQQADVASCHLDFHYSYGFSVMSSHLVRGASLALDDGKFTDRSFWESVDSASVTHLPGVPVHHEILARLGYEKMLPQSVLTLTQAGGRLGERFSNLAHACMNARGGSFHVMYGQTEASPRMASLPHDQYCDKPRCVGVALSAGVFTIDVKSLNNRHGEIVYEGPNVMMGYAMSADDLSEGDVQGSMLHTGDLGYLDEEGCLFVTGRMSRMGKLYGLRLNLDELEQSVTADYPYYLVQRDDHIAVVGCVDDSVKSVTQAEVSIRASLETVTIELANSVDLTPTTFRPYLVYDLPRNSRGKIDYFSLGNLLNEL